MGWFRRRQGDLPRIRIDVHRLAEHDPRVAPLAENGAQRRGDLGRTKRAGGNLVKQRLEQVKVAPVDQSQIDTFVLGQLLRRIQTAKAAADHDHSMMSRVLGKRVVRFAC